MADFLYMRDQIVINDDLNAIVGTQLEAGSTIRLVGRQIRHDAGVTLKASGSNVNVVIVADEYDNSAGGGIDMSGVAGAVGAGGSTGSLGHATSTGIGNQPGGPGSPGGVGAGGSGATSVRLTCERILNAHVVANGGAGGVGGAGGDGGNGGVGRRKGGVDPEIIEGTSGGNGGPGGTGGHGGPGGQALAVFITASAAPVLEVAGGPGGAGGTGGHRGIKGAFSVDDDGKPGGAGAHGLLGAPGTATNLQVDADTYWERVKAELGASVADWAAYRLAVGEYHYRAYNPEDPSRADFLIVAVREFDAVLRLDPSNAEAARLQEQILMNQNVLGLPRDLDLIPHFDEYIAAFQKFGSFVFGVFNQGIMEILSANNLEHLKETVDLQRQSEEGAIVDTENELQAAKDAQKDADDEVQQADARVAEVNSQIQAALEEMNNHSFSIGGLVGIVGEIGGAVLAVATILPSAGTSLVALVPDVVALTESVSANAGPIVDALFRTEAPDIKNITEAYKKVNKDGAEILKDVKLVLNFVNLVHKLAEGSTPDNSKYVALLQRSVDLMHAKVLAEKRKAQADHTVVAVGAKLDRAKALLVKTQDLLNHLSLEVGVLSDGGLRAIRNAQMHLDSVLTFAFRAQRSVEIYTLKSEVQNLFLDAGYVHPDVDRDFAERLIGSAGLVAAYSDSWARLLQPVEMQADYLAYFSDHRLDDDSRRLSFMDPEMLQTFRDTHDLTFAFDIADLPAAHSDAKVQGVFVAFVGATSSSGVISCEVRHGDRYEQKRPDGSVVVQLLEPRADIQQAGTTRLELAGVSFVSAPPLTAPQSLSFWGRGVAGRWSVSIPESEFNLDPPDLSELSEIQVWVGYQFVS